MRLPRLREVRANADGLRERERLRSVSVGQPGVAVPVK